MNERIMEAVREIEDIRDAMGKDYPWENAAGEMVENWQYFDEDDTPEESVPKERAIKDRAKMLEVLRRFYRTYAVDFEGMDDFVTLFGVYCNHYIRFNLHRAIPNEDDFGISALWDVVTDVKNQEYLCLIQQGIFKGFEEFLDGTNYFLKADNMFPESYSLPNLYLFIYLAILWPLSEEDEKQNIEDMMSECFEDMSESFQQYSFGMSPFQRPVIDGVIDQNPLPYIRYGIMKEHRAASLANKMADAILTIKKYFEKGVKDDRFDETFDETYDEAFNNLDFKMALHNAVEGAEGVNDLRKDKDSDEIKFVPQEWRDEDGIIYRLKFLTIPCLLDWLGNRTFSGRIMSNKYTNYLKKELEDTLQEKNEIVQDFSHTYQNMTATALYQVAIALLSRTTEEDLALGRTALLEYTRKETLTKDVYMMKLKYENNTEKLRSILRQSCKFPSPEMHTIHEVANQALLTALISAFYDEGQGNAVAMFDNLNMFWPSMEEIVLSFEKEVIQHETDCLAWIKTKGIDLCMEESEQWMSIGFVPNGYAEVLLRNIITELFVNFFKYGDQKQKVLLSFQGDNSTYDSLHIRMENFLLNGKRVTSNSQVGLHAMSKMLRVLWDDREEKKRIVTDYVDDKFITRLRLPLAVFQQRGEEK